MAGYDPKAKRAHSTPAPEGPAPVDDLLSAPGAAPAPTAGRETAPTPVATAAPAAERAAPSLATTPRPAAPPTGPGPKVLALAAGVAVLAIVLWRRRR